MYVGVAGDNTHIERWQVLVKDITCFRPRTREVDLSECLYIVYRRSRTHIVNRERDLALQSEGFAGTGQRI